MNGPDAIIPGEESIDSAIKISLGAEKARAWRRTYHEMMEHEYRRRAIAAIGADASIPDDDLAIAGKIWIAEKLSAAGVDRDELWKHEPLWVEVMAVDGWLFWHATNRIKPPRSVEELTDSPAPSAHRRSDAPAPDLDEDPERPQLRVIEGTAREHALLKRELFPEFVRPSLEGLERERF